MSHINGNKKGGFMKRTLILSLVLPLMLIGCVTVAASHKMGSVSLGMNKQQVIEALGTPTSVSAKEDTEYLNYNFYEKTNLFFPNFKKKYFVRLINGKVDAYGKVGDFDSTQDPKQKIDLTIEQKK